MKTKNPRQDLFLMLFFMLLAIALIFYIIPNQIKITSIMEAETFSPRSVPYLASGGLLLFSTVGFLQSLAACIKLRAPEKQAAKAKRTKEEWTDLLFPYFIFVLIFSYYLLFRYFGIVIASVIVPPVMLWCLRCRKWYMYAIYYVFFAIMYLLFTAVLGVPIK